MYFWHFHAITNAIWILIFILLFFIIYPLIHTYYLIDWLIVRNAFNKINFVNKDGEAPILRKFEHNDEQYQLTFYSPGLTMEDWKKRQLQLENAFNISIYSLTLTDTHDCIALRASRGLFDYTRDYSFNPHTDCLQYDGFNLGVCAIGSVVVDLHIHPHILIGGSTGSGKTILLKSIVKQSMDKAFNIYICDFKGGVDYPREWREQCHFITSIEATIDMLQSALRILECRREQLLEADCPNINDFNYYHSPYTPMRRVLIFIDELAELTDTTGRSKDDIALIRTIINLLSTIARQGRAFGIHLILSTQRPDANILPGQIKNNISYRVCGRADMVLSQIILDNTDAYHNIPSDIQGVFINQDGTMFKGYID